ncbi:MAG TPA: TIR domain-containing protein [Candidatus Bathyarchaeia archaeon]|nr:TIR domain-containing protein [Candidatus Bathyarchaeia archaeon]
MPRPLVLEGCWIVPRQDLHFLESGRVNAELRNTSGTKLILEDLAVIFQAERGLRSLEARTRKRVVIEPKGRIRVTVQFLAELSLIPYTNTFSFITHYRTIGSSTSTKLDIPPPPFQNVLSLYPSARTEHYFFLSHRIPDDEELASKLDRYLQKIGYAGFLAEGELRIGAKVWEEKIEPAMQDPRCSGVIFLWTSKAHNHPAAMRRELKLAKKYKKKVMLLLQKRVPRPEGFPRKPEFQLSVGNTIGDFDLIELTKSIARAHVRGEI